jgi:hypothetical protein
MHPALRLTLAVVAGAVVAFSTVALIESIGHRVYPMPAGLDWSKPEQVRAYVDGLPLGALLFVLGGWIVAALVGGLVAAWIARARAVLAAAIVGAVVLAATVANLAMIPHPTWFAVVGVAGIVLAAFVAGRIMRAGGTP